VSLILNPLVLVPLALASMLALARIASLRRRLRPLVLPYMVTAVVITGLVLRGTPPGQEERQLSILYLLPLLVLLVRAVALLALGLFRRRQGMDAPALLGSVISVLLYGVGAGLIANRFFGVDLTPFLATSAVVGAVVGLALQDTLGNLFAGIALHTESPFRVGDWVRVGDRDGRVEQVSWRAIQLRTWDGDTLTVPNNEAAKHAILNYSEPRQPHTRIITIGVNYHTPPNKVISVLSGLAEQVQGMPRLPAPSIRIIGYHDFSITYEVRYPFASYDDYRRYEGELYRLIWYHFRRHGIEIPFPVRNVYVHKVEGGTDPHDAPATRLQRALRQIDLFRPLSDEELVTATGRFRPLHYAAGERIIVEDSPGDSFFVIDRGEVEVWKTLGGTSRPLARLMEGQFFGEMALLTGETRSATVVAATDVDLFTIDKAGFHDILVANPAIAVDISTILSERQEALEQAEGDITNRFDAASSRGELKERILDRIRGYFGL
jgi:small-conductance mechanosensitive channel/CRP-like cAMP-binding protein